MQKFFLLSLLAICSLNVNAEEELHRIYAHVGVFQNGCVTIMDESVHWWGAFYNSFDKKQLMVDENGELLTFNNYLPVIGYFQSRGWTFPNLDAQLMAAPEMTTSNRHVVIFLMYHEATEAEWLEWIERGKFKKK